MKSPTFLFRPFGKSLLLVLSLLFSVSANALVHDNVLPQDKQPPTGLTFINNIEPSDRFADVLRLNKSGYCIHSAQIDNSSTEQLSNEQLLDWISLSASC